MPRILSDEDTTYAAILLNNDQRRIAALLRDEGLLEGSDETIRFSPLSGGVSSDIFLVTDGQNKIVVKRALEKLRVKDDWYADVARNHYEHEYLRFAATYDPDIVPRVVYANDDMGFFVMEYLSDGFVTWKRDLLEKKISHTPARKAGNILGGIHKASWNDATLRRRFDTTEQFIQLRVDPYLYTTGARTPSMQMLFDAEGRRLIHHRRCLVHGDYSPKNLLVGHGRLVIIDCEVAWFGDPTFDVCFLMNHLFLKAVFNNDRAGEYMELVRLFWDSYANALGKEYLADIEHHVGRLLLMLMLARVDGKSPAEYLTDDKKKDIIRVFVRHNLTKDFFTDPVRNLSELWTRVIKDALNTELT